MLSGATLTWPSSAELEAGQAAESRDVLVLFADRLLQNFDLDLAGLFGDQGRIDVLALERRELRAAARR